MAWKGKKPGLRRDNLAPQARKARDSKLNKLRAKEKVVNKNNNPFSGMLSKKDGGMDEGM